MRLACTHHMNQLLVIKVTRTPQNVTDQNFTTLLLRNTADGGISSEGLPTLSIVCART